MTSIELPEPDEIELNRIYTEGGVPFRLPPAICQMFNMLIDREQWVTDESGTYRRVPAWSAAANDGTQFMTGAEHDARQLQQLPQRYARAIDRLLSPTLLGYRFKRAGKLILQSVDLWDGVEGLDWHWDGRENFDLNILIYFTSASGWQDSWGGHLCWGERDILGDLEDPAGDVRELGRLAPMNGCGVMMGNRNPRHVHKPLPLSADAPDRIALTLCASLDAGWDTPGTDRGY